MEPRMAKIGQMKPGDVIIYLESPSNAELFYGFRLSSRFFQEIPARLLGKPKNEYCLKSDLEGVLECLETKNKIAIFEECESGTRYRFPNLHSLIENIEFEFLLNQTLTDESVNSLKLAVDKALESNELDERDQDDLLKLQARVNYIENNLNDLEPFHIHYEERKCEPGSLPAGCIAHDKVYDDPDLLADISSSRPSHTM